MKQEPLRCICLRESFRIIPISKKIKDDLFTCTTCNTVFSRDGLIKATTEFYNSQSINKK